MTAESSRKFSVHPAIIYNLIVAQAGTLAKAVLEGVMNSIDAAATRVDIEIDRKGVRIQDDGQGFRSRQEIEQWFEVFGFPHDEKDHRVYGKFGIGRGQLWSFCSTIWRTGTFKMDVDIKQRGLDYNLGREPRGCERRLDRRYVLHPAHHARDFDVPKGDRRARALRADPRSASTASV